MNSLLLKPTWYIVTLLNISTIRCLPNTGCMRKTSFKCFWHDFDADLHDCQDRSPSPCLTIPRPGDSSWPQLHSCRSIGHNYVPKCCHKWCPFLKCQKHNNKLSPCFSNPLGCLRISVWAVLNPWFVSKAPLKYLMTSSAVVAPLTS